MSDSCPVLTPAERQYLEIQEKAERAMMVAIHAAVEAAQRQAAEALQDCGSRQAPPARDYFAAVAHQKLFLMLCGADPESFAGGNAEIAGRIIANSKAIADHYWRKGKAEPE